MLISFRDKRVGVQVKLPYLSASAVRYLHLGALYQINDLYLLPFPRVEGLGPHLIHYLAPKSLYPK